MCCGAAVTMWSRASLYSSIAPEYAQSWRANLVVGRSPLHLVPHIRIQADRVVMRLG